MWFEPPSRYTVCKGPARTTATWGWSCESARIFPNTLDVVSAHACACAQCTADERLKTSFRTQAAVRKEVASAIIKAVVAVKGAEITPDKVVVRFGEAVDGWPLPEGHTHKNVDERPKDK